MPTPNDRNASAPPGALARLGGTSVIRPRPIDLYDAWLFAEADATLALAAWSSAPSDGKREAYALYVAALDRETRAAAALAIRLAPAGR